MAQIQALDGSLEHAVDAYNLANERLEAIRGDLNENRVNLSDRRENLHRARRSSQPGWWRSTRPIRAIRRWTCSSAPRSLEDLLDGLETVPRVSEQDTAVLTDVTAFRADMRRARARLRHARDRQADLVAERAAAQGVDREQALRAAADALVDQVRDRGDSGGRAAPTGAARRTGARPPGGAAAADPGSGDLRALGAGADRSAAGSGRQVRRGRGDRDAVPRHPVRVRRRKPVGVRLLRLHHVRLLRRSGSRCPTTLRRSTATGRRSTAASSSPATWCSSTASAMLASTSAGASFIHSPHTGDVVKISSMSGWYSSTYVGARRL